MMASPLPITSTKALRWTKGKALLPVSKAPKLPRVSSQHQARLLEFVNYFGLTLLCIRPRKAYLSPALIWLEEEGLPTAEMEAKDMVKALGGEMDKEAATRRAMEKWKRMSVEEKAVWRLMAKAKEGTNTNQK